MFIIILYSLIRLKKKQNKDKKSTSNKQQLIIAITLSSLFGLGWGIGLLATQDIYSNKTVHDIIAALFILLTTFHGVFIFTMRCLRSEKVRKVWKKWFFGVIGSYFVSHKDDTTSTSGSKDATLKSIPAVDSSIEEVVVSCNIDTSLEKTLQKHNVYY